MKIILRKTLIVLTIHLLVFALVGCGDKTQRDVTQYLFEPFVLPRKEQARQDFLMEVKLRARVHTNSIVVEYKFIPFMIKADRNDFCDSMCALVHCILNDPDQGIMSLHEEWYYAHSSWEPPLLLRRKVIGTEEKSFVLDQFAIETVITSNTVYTPKSGNDN